MKKILERLKKVLGKIFASLAGVLFLLLIIWVAFCVVKNGREKEKVAPTSATVETTEKEVETSEKKTEPQIVIQNLVQGDVYNQKSRTTQVYPAKEKEVKAAKKVTPATKKTVEKPNEIEKLRAEIVELIAYLQEQIQYLQTETEIRGPEDFTEVNAQIAGLKDEVVYLRSLLLESLQQDPQVVEHYHYYRTLPYFYPYAQLYFLGLLPYYPYYFNPFGWYYPYYSRYYGGYGYSGYDSYDSRGQTVISRNQLKQRRPIRTYSPRTQSRSYSSRTNIKKVAKIPGNRQSPWGNLDSQKSSSKSKVISRSSGRSRTGIQRISRPTKIRSSSSLRSNRGSTRTTKIKSTKIRKK